jgi:hypothetical protein
MRDDRRLVSLSCTLRTHSRRAARYILLVHGHRRSADSVSVVKLKHAFCRSSIQEVGDIASNPNCQNLSSCRPISVRPGGGLLLLHLDRHVGSTSMGREKNTIDCNIDAKVTGLDYKSMGRCFVLFRNVCKTNSMVVGLLPIDRDRWVRLSIMAKV